MELAPEDVLVSMLDEVSCSLLNVLLDHVLAFQELILRYTNLTNVSLAKKTFGMFTYVLGFKLCIASSLSDSDMPLFGSLSCLASDLCKS